MYSVHNKLAMITTLYITGLEAIHKSVNFAPNQAVKSCITLTILKMNGFDYVSDI